MYIKAIGNSASLQAQPALQKILRDRDEPLYIRVECVWAHRHIIRQARQIVSNMGPQDYTIQKNKKCCHDTLRRPYWTGFATKSEVVKHAILTMIEDVSTAPKTPRGSDLPQQFDMKGNDVTSNEKMLFFSIIYVPNVSTYTFFWQL